MARRKKAKEEKFDPKRLELKIKFFFFDNFLDSGNIKYARRIE